MDFSMLLVIERSNVHVKYSQTDSCLDLSRNMLETNSACQETEIIHVGIIDYLTKWDIFKKSEKFGKVHFKMKDAKLISCMPPVEYAERFVKSLNEIFSEPQRQRAESINNLL